MKKNYNYNYVNRTSVQKPAVEFGNVEVASCTSATLKKSTITNGMLWHTTDTNEFYYDWNDKRSKLNVSGDNESINAEIKKLKSDVAKLNPDTIESKINNATSKAQKAVNRAEAAVASVNNIKSEVNAAKAQADAASAAAQAVVADVEAAVASVENKADKSYVDDAISTISLTPGPKGDTGAKGDKGDKGDTGAAGEKGDKGDKGDTGEKGEKGDTGEKGEKGDPGANGQDGAKGDKGDKGDTGEKGEKGDTGEKGDKGDKGDTGEKGDKGDKGEDGEGLSQEDRDKIDALPEEGTFPTLDNNGDPITNTGVDGFATVDAIVAYVNELVSKKKVDDGDSDSDSDVPVRYAYITGYPLNGTPTNITVFNPFELEEVGDTEIEFYSAQEIAAWDPSTNDDLPSIKLTVDIPNGYVISTAYIWNTLTNAYQVITGENSFDVNPRYSTRLIDGNTYLSYTRGPVNETETRGTTRYKIIITKQ